jgi:hypothetical protein
MKGNTLTFRRAFKGGSSCEIVVDLDAVQANTYCACFNWRGSPFERSGEFEGWAEFIHLSTIEHLGLPDLQAELDSSLNLAIALAYAQHRQQGADV